MKIEKRATLPLGFKASAVAAGIKKSGKLDLALFYSGVPAQAVCRFTANKIQAAPIKLNKEHLKRKKNFRGIIVNSGNANCFTGNLGLEDADKTMRDLAAILKVEKEEILVCSTGIIGRRLPVAKINQAMPGLVAGLSRPGIAKAKRAILTTDTFSKEITVKFNIANKTITLCGIAKGAGMIAPNLATMLCFIFTDARITPGAFKKAVEDSLENSFNCITVDGCMSTNDSVMALANGAAGNSLIDKGRNFNLFLKAINLVCLELAKMVVQDAEGATKFIQIKVSQARDFYQARKIALSIANSNLFKTAMYGENPNFGRIVASIGASGVDVKEEDLKINCSSLLKKEININVFVNQGNASAVVYTSDLTPEYIKINAEYN